jgi:ABC-2 type transport system permease protein
MVTWILARKDLRLLLRDPKAVIILLAMPLLFVLVLGFAVGEGFGQKPDDRLRVSVVDLDRGYQPGGRPTFPHKPWSKVVLEDLAQTAGIRVELIESREEAQELVSGGRRAAVLVLGPDFSERVNNSSFLAEGLNPFHRDGVDIKTLSAEMLRDPTQLTGAAIMEQAVQGSLLRVILPWMIGQAFAKVGDPEFIDRLSKDKTLNIQVADPIFGRIKFDLRKLLAKFPPKQKQELAAGLQNALQGMFPKYDLTAKTWASLTRSEPHTEPGTAPATYKDQEGAGLLRRGALRYQLLVPSSMVMFAFCLVLMVGWLFVSERRQGTLKRLRAAPLSKAQILLGKLVPCYLLSVGQGLFLLGAGKLVFGMSWGGEPLLLVPVVLATSLAAMGLALLVAALARTETQVAIFGTLLVLVLALVSGSLMGDRELMPPTMQEISRLTPHAWSLDAYRQLLANPGAPNLAVVGLACAVLTGFGVLFVVLAWWSLKLE